MIVQSDSLPRPANRLGQPARRLRSSDGRRLPQRLRSLGERRSEGEPISGAWLLRASSLDAGGPERF